MIVDSIFRLATTVLHYLNDGLPIGTLLTLPSPVEFGTKVGAAVGPFNQILPVSEIMSQTVIFVTVYLPASIAYSITFWIYRHLPIIGKG